MNSAQISQARQPARNESRFMAKPQRNPAVPNVLRTPDLIYKL